MPRIARGNRIVSINMITFPIFILNIGIIFEPQNHTNFSLLKLTAAVYLMTILSLIRN